MTLERSLEANRAMAQFMAPVRAFGIPRLLLLGAVAITLARLLYSGLYWPATNHSWLALSNDELLPLFGLLWEDRPIEEINPRQYGVVLFLAAHLPAALAPGDLRLMELWMLLVGHVALLVALVVCVRRFSIAAVGGYGLALVLLWYNFTPLYHIIGTKTVESWQLLFLSISVALFISPNRWIRALAGIPIGLGVMTKLLPLVVLGYFFVRDRRAFAAGALAIAALVGVGHFLYGSLMGLQYLPTVLSQASALSDWTALWHENDSLRGIVYKLAAGFQLVPKGYDALLPPERSQVARMVSDLLALSAVAYLSLVAFIGRRSADPARRAIDLSLAILVMLLVSPGTPHEYMILTLPVFAVLFWLVARDGIAWWPLGVRVGLVTAFVLIAAPLPMQVFARAFPLDALRELTGTNHLDASQAYRFFAFPGIGLLSLTVVVAWMGQHLARSTTDKGRHHHEGWLHALTTQPTVYDLYQRFISADYRAIKERLARFIVPGIAHFDVACGTGNLYPFVRDRGAGYVGVDIDPDAIARARERFPEADFRLLDAMRADALGRTFDRIFSVGLLHHLDDEEADRVLRALRRILAADGVCLVIDAIPPRAPWNFVGWLLRRLDNGAHIRRAEAHRSLLERHFRVATVEEFGRFPLDYVAFEATP